MEKLLVDIQTILKELSGVITTIFTLLVAFKGVFGGKRIKATNNFLVECMTKKMKEPVPNVYNYNDMTRYYQTIEKRICAANSVMPIYLLLPLQVLNKAYINALKEGTNFETLNRNYSLWSHSIESIQKNRHNKINTVAILASSMLLFLFECLVLKMDIGTSVCGSFVVTCGIYGVFFKGVPWILLKISNHL